MTGPIRVVVVEDSLTMRERLLEVLRSDPGFEIVGVATDGKEAIELCQRLRPDVMTMDMMLPIMTGQAATEYIMAHCPVPILIVSSSFNRGEVFRTYEALAAGAVDVLEKPTGFETEGVWERRFLSTLRLVSRVKVITHPRAKLGRWSGAETAFSRKIAKRTNQHKIVAIGASTGGPGAIVEVLRGLPADYPIPIVLVLHLSEGFAAGFAEWLSGLLALKVEFPAEGRSLAQSAGWVLIAPPSRHMLVSGGHIAFSDAPERHSCRPSVDVLFESVASEYGAAAVGCLLTGMGRDGATGLLQMHQAGGLTLAQDEATCVVYGMPREAAILGAASQILPLDEIGPALASSAPVETEVRHTDAHSHR